MTIFFFLGAALFSSGKVIATGGTENSRGSESSSEAKNRLSSQVWNKIRYYLNRDILLFPQHPFQEEQDAQTDLLSHQLLTVTFGPDNVIYTNGHLNGFLSWIRQRSRQLNIPVDLAKLRQFLSEDSKNAVLFFEQKEGYRKAPKTTIVLLVSQEQIVARGKSEDSDSVSKMSRTEVRKLRALQLAIELLKNSSDSTSDQPTFDFSDAILEIQ